MAANNTGIEHRSVASVLQAFNSYGYMNYAIYAGNRLVLKYDRGVVDEAIPMLEQQLTFIQDSGTQTVYTLFVYPNSVKEITNKSDYTGSLTFQFAQFVPKGEGGTIVLPGNNAGAGMPLAREQMLLGKIDELQKSQMDLLTQMHKNELQQIRHEMDNKIAGLKKESKPEKKDGWGKFTDMLERSGIDLNKTIGRLFDMAESAIKKERKDFIQPRNEGALAGTQHQSTGEKPENTDSMETSKTSEGALINPFLTPDERKLKTSQQNKLTEARLEGLDEEQLEEVQNECLDIIQERISAKTTALMLLAVACMDNEDLNKLLNHLQ